MEDFQQGIKVDEALPGTTPGVTVVVRIAPEYDTLKCLQESLVHAEQQAKNLLDHVAKVLGPRGFTFEIPGEASVESSEYFLFLFMSADLGTGEDVKALKELMNDLGDLDSTDDPEHLGKVSNEEAELGRMYVFVDRDGDIFEGGDL